MQIAIIEFARNVLGLDGANSAEINPDTAHPVIDILPGAKGCRGNGRNHASWQVSMCSQSRIKSLCAL